MTYPETAAGETSAGAALEGVAALAAVALAVIGLAGIAPPRLAAIGTLVIGASMMTECWAASARFRNRVAQGVSQVFEVRHNLSGEFLGGVAGIVLGILAFFQSAPILLAVAVLVFGATLLFSGTTPRIQWLFVPQGQNAASETARAASMSAPGGYLLVGLGATVLGILAIIGLAQMTLILVGLLCLGAAMALGQIRM